MSHSLYNFTFSLHSLINTNFSLLYIYVYCNISIYFIVISLPSFRSQNNIDHWYQIMLLIVISLCMSPTSSWYRELGLKLVSLEDNHPKRTPMAEQKRYAGEEYFINLFLEESVTRQRDEMMDNFVEIL